MALLRVFGMLLVFLTVVYVCVSLYSRAVRRDKLIARWEEGGRIGERREFVRRGLREYDKSFRRRLILGVYIVPLTLIGIIVYVVNYM